MATPFTAQPLDAATLDRAFSRADVEFLGVDHSGSTYEGRVFLNNPSADAKTDRTLEAGYAGSYFIFGHGGCLGDEGHCDVKPRRLYDPRPGHHLTGGRKVVIATQAVRRALADAIEVTVTVVPVILAVGPSSGWEDEVLGLEAIRIVTYR